MINRVAQWKYIVSEQLLQEARGGFTVETLITLCLLYMKHNQALSRPSGNHGTCARLTGVLVPSFRASVVAIDATAPCGVASGKAKLLVRACSGRPGRNTVLDIPYLNPKLSVLCP